jgi:c(7)-type cytochrome triheme protein
MRPVTLVGLLAVGLGIGLATGSPSAAQVKLPPDFRMDKADSSPGAVTFSHEKHRGKVEKCTTCHMKHFRMKRGQSEKVTLAAKQEGKLCGACHDGKTKTGGAVVFPIDECDRCHKD